MKVQQILVPLVFSSLSSQVLGDCVSIDGKCLHHDEHEPSSSTSSTDASRTTDECKDLDDRCTAWEHQGECVVNIDFMSKKCPRSCFVCRTNEPVSTEPCVDNHAQCATWERQNQCARNPYFMLSNCPKACKACKSSTSQTVDFGVRQKQDENNTLVAAVIHQSIHYMRQVMADPRSAAARELCRNGNEMCSIWAAQGHCRNPAIQSLCAPACHSCNVVDVAKQCEMDSNNAIDVLKKKGDLTDLFETMIERDDFAGYSPSILYRPYKEGTTSYPGPWFLTFDNFLSDDEIERMLYHGERRVYGRSEEVTIEVKVGGTYSFRASSYNTPFRSWCDYTCEEDPVIQRLLDRVANLTGVPKEHAEPLQLSRYQRGQRHGVHHDYNVIHKVRPCGVRILTFTFFLNDDFQGGETHFGVLHKKKITPKKGKAVLWANVLDNDPNEAENKLHHEVLPVTRGTKFTANLFLHQRDFRNSFRMQFS